VKRLLEAPPASLLLIRLPAQMERLSTQLLGAQFLSWLHQLWQQQEDAWFVQDGPPVEEPSWTRTEEHNLG
jgi:hypothetical protein